MASKRILIIGGFVALTAALASPALAKTSLTKGGQLCEKAAEKSSPAPKSVRVDDDRTVVSEAQLVFTLKVKKADDSSGKMSCTVNRDTDDVTIADAS